MASAIRWDCFVVFLAGISLAAAQNIDDNLFRYSTCEQKATNRKCFQLSACPSGYTLETSTQRTFLSFRYNYFLCFGQGVCCILTDACLANKHNCSSGADCTAIDGGGFTCQCRQGYEGNPYNSVCSDINECAQVPSVCGTNALCSNFDGGYVCSCPSGYSGDPQVNCIDNNECLQSPSPCPAPANCVNQPGTYTCECPSGYEGNPFTQCTEINECSVNPNICGLGSTCQNTIGSYTCSDVDECLANPTICGSGYTCSNTIGSYACNDINECTNNPSICGAGSTCENTIGSYTCSDVNECLVTPTICGSGYTCVDTIGSYACNDVNECFANPTICGSGYSCTNTIGSYTCADINECTNNPSICGAGSTCQNTIGSYTCTDVNECVQTPTICGTGYRCADTVGSYTCTDIDECLENTHLCQANSQCTNNPGSYGCVCLDGYEGNGFTTGGCVDIDECARLTDNCHDTLATCQNTIGSFQCTCIAGYSGDGVTCANIDECALGTGPCADNAVCTDTIGSYTCACMTGYTGDGYVSCTSSMNHPECGISPTSRMAGGAFDTPCTNPWQISFRTYFDPSLLNQPMSMDTSFHSGSGILIQDKWVLTTPFSLIRAGRALANHPTFNYSVFAVAGDFTLDLNEATEQMIAVKRVLFHPFSPFKVTDDFLSLISQLKVNPIDISDHQKAFAFALVELANPVIINNCVRPACMPTDIDYPETCGVPTCRMTGWGDDPSYTDLAQELQTGNVELFDADSCESLKYYLQNQAIVPQPTATLCALSPNGTAPCLGDFGGPVVCQDAGSSRFVVEGITLMESIDCNVTTTEPFTVARVRDAISWIETVFQTYP